MSREEILKKAQRHRPNQADEMEVSFQNQGDRLALLVLAGVELICVVARGIAGQTVFDSWLLLCVINGVPKLYTGVRLRRRSHLLLGIAYCIMTAVTLVLYIRFILGEV